MGSYFSHTAMDDDGWISGLKCILDAPIVLKYRFYLFVGSGMINVTETISILS